MGYTVGQSDVRTPRGVVKINGTPITGWVGFSVDNNSFNAADTFSVDFVISALPSTRDVAWFAEQADMYVELFAGFPDDPTSYSATDLTSWIYGQVDDISVDLEGGMIKVSGRDLTRVFIDTKTTRKWPNLTASQIVIQLAVAHGLTPVVTATTEKAGKYYELDYVNMADERTEWDIICYLAQVSQYRAYVKGQSLYFEPIPSEDDDSSFVPPWTIIWQPDDAGGAPAANVIQPMFSRNLNVSRGIQVVVRSWNAKQKRAFNATYPTSKATTLKPGQSSTSSQVYRRTIMGLTQEQATKRAQQIYAQLVQHEMILTFRAPADNDLDVTRYITVSGTGTAFDQSYFPDSITRSLDVAGGYSMSVHAKNHSPYSDVEA